VPAPEPAGYRLKTRQNPSMTDIDTGLDSLDRDELVRIAHEYMLSGMLATRAMLSQVAAAGGGLDAINSVAIDEWMGASPVYTGRMRRLMGVDGDNVEAIMKSLQLDVGFVHQYMDVAYKLIDDRHGEFWLQHCGALLDTEPIGEDAVFGMCHTIEDPTFDATALAINPRARIRPIHRPPRQPADRHPHCHWTIEIDPDNEPVGPVPLTDRVGALALASVPNQARPSTASSTDGMRDYRSALRPGFRLADLESGTLAAVAREFQMQTHLLMCAGEFALRDRFGEDAAREMIAATWVGAGWVISDRLAAAFGRAADPAGLAHVLAIHPMVAPGLTPAVHVRDDRVVVTLTPSVQGLLGDGHPGCPGVLARRDSRGLEAMVHAVAPTAAVEVAVADDRVTIEVDAAAGRDPAKLPDAAALTRIGIAASWTFTTA
jgi:hypothetical protein